MVKAKHYGPNLALLTLHESHPSTNIRHTVITCKSASLMERMGEQQLVTLHNALLEEAEILQR